MLTVNDTIAALEIRIKSIYDELVNIGKALTEKRKKGAKKLTPKVLDLIHELGMPNARFDVSFSDITALTPSGADDVQFLFSANKGSALQPLQAVASGGELSRLSLALKSIYASKAALPTIIFDEIDTGISGEVAWRMGQLILGLAKGHQVLMITHSPQIAAHADHQYHVSKVTSGNKDISAINLLNTNQRVQEIAKMLSGDPPSKAAISNAESLLEAVK
jgi:DNA repair protein RecN (Recombination protein N)